MSLFKRLLGKDFAPAPAPPDTPVLVNAYATVIALPPLDFAHELRGQRDRSDPELAPHLDGFINYVMSRGDGQMTAARYHLWRHLQRVRNHVSLEVAPAELPVFERWAHAANAVLFVPDGSVRAPDFTVLMSPEGETDPAATLPYPPDAVARRERTRARLAGAELRPPASMPPALGEPEVALRPAEAVRDRALALFFVAAHAQARATGGPLILPGQEAENPRGAAALTPAERGFVDGEGDADAARILTWRYEAANTLLWALDSPAAELDASDALADVDLVWAAAEDLVRGAATPRLRPTSELLDALDRTWLEHWIVRQAQQTGTALATINGDVIAERHVALNWLFTFQNAFGTGWDEIDTPS